MFQFHGILYHEGEINCWRRSVISECFIMMDSVSPQSRILVHGLGPGSAWGSDWEGWLSLFSRHTCVNGKVQISVDAI